MNQSEKNKARFNVKNERMKYAYKKHLARIGQKDEKTILAALKHIRDFEIFIDFKGYEAFNDDIADQYIKSIFKSDKSLSFINDNLRALKDFLNWLERQRGYRSKINYNHIEYLNISNNQRKTAKAQAYQKSYKFDDIIKTIRAMPDQTTKEKRDKAVISLQALCALRISELRTVKIENIIKEDDIYFIDANPKSMKTKFAKSRHAVFMPLPEDIIANVIIWRDYLISIGFKQKEPLFPVIDNHFNSFNLLEQDITHSEIKSDTTIRNIFKKAFEAVGFDYLNPHSFRKTIARYAETQSPQFLNAVRQNLGHRSIDTTLNSYGQLSHYEQRRVMSENIFTQ